MALRVRGTVLWTVDCSGHGTQLEFDEAGGYAAVVVWLNF